MASSFVVSPVLQTLLMALLTGVILTHAPSAAAETGARDPQWFAEQGDRAAEKIRSAHAADTISKRNDLADKAIAILNQLISHPDADQETIVRSRFDRLMALRVRESMAEVVDAWEALLTDGLEPPAYVTVAAADALLYLRQPEKAEKLYQRAQEMDAHHTGSRQAMFWALLEQEAFDRALDLIDQVVVDTEPNSKERLQARITAAMGRAYANRLDEAQDMLEAVVREYPESADASRALTTIYRWRGWPNRAMATLEPLLDQSPEHTENRLLLAGLMRDLGQFRQAGEAFESLHDDHPEHRHVQRDFADWNTRKRWSMTTGGEYGDSDNSVSDFGSRDRSWDLRLDAPWIGHYVQPFARIRYSDATFPEGKAEYDRVGAGINWRRHRHHAHLEIHRSRTDEAETGISAGYDWHTGDQWSFATRYESFSTDVPLRARGQGLDGWKAEAAARWQAHESLSVRTGISRLAISDGNVRLAALGTVRHRLQASAHNVTDGTLGVYVSRASQSGGPYFNPERDSSLTYIIQHDWLTWRRYERSLTQRFTLGGGTYWQEDFGTHAIGLARYEHLWQLNSHWFIRYGMGISNRVYDGDRETRIDGQLRLEGVF